MKVTRFVPPAPPATYRLEFSHSDGWALVTALREYAERHPDAAHAEEWARWAKDLDRELRR